MLTWTEGFNLSRYGNKLPSPLIQIETILEFCISSTYQYLFEKSFKVHACPCPSKPTSSSLPDDWKTEDKFKTFINEIYQNTAWDDSAETSEALINDLSATAVKKISLTSTARPHCECLLIQHHYTTGTTIMESYIAISKLSCLQCGIFLDAYNENFSEQQFFIRGRHNNIYPCIVPSIGDGKKDVTIGKGMKASLTRVINRFIHGLVENLPTRTLSESTAASDYNSEDAGQSVDSSVKDSESDKLA